VLATATATGLPMCTSLTGDLYHHKEQGAAHMVLSNKALHAKSASIGCSISGSDFDHLPSLKEGQDNSKGAADRKKVS